MTPEETKAVNCAVENGDFAVAVAVLADKIDLRAAELPKIEKKPLAALAAHLKGNQACAEALASAFFHENITIRRFARKTTQSLKDAAEPLARPLADALDAYVRVTTIWPRRWEATPPQTKHRNEQSEAVSSAVEMIMKNRPDVVLDLVERYAPIWGERMEQLSRARIALEEQWQAYSVVYQRKKSAMWQARAAELGISVDRVPGSVEEKWSRELEKDPELIAVTPGLREYETPRDAKSETILTEVVTLQETLQPHFYKLAQDEGKAPHCVALIGDRLWQWIERLADGDQTAEHCLASMNLICGSHSAWKFLGVERVLERMQGVLERAISAGKAETLAYLFPLMCYATVLQICIENPSSATLPAHITSKRVRALSVRGALNRTADSLAAMKGA